jgi:uncharacterized integral membrane protein
MLRRVSSETPTPRTEPGASPQRREGLRVGIAVALGALIVAFAALNTDEVEVNWILGTWSTPLIVVIAVSTLVGAGIDRAVTLLAARRKRSKARDASR